MNAEYKHALAAETVNPQVNVLFNWPCVNLGVLCILVSVACLHGSVVCAPYVHCCVYVSCTSGYRLYMGISCVHECVMC